jgi:hypothetical protein
MPSDTKHTILELEYFIKKNRKKNKYYLEIPKKLSETKIGRVEQSVRNSIGGGGSLSKSQRARVRVRKISDGKVEYLS